jgi:FkbM family methyltransferase
LVLWSATAVDNTASVRHGGAVRETDNDFRPECNAALFQSERGSGECQGEAMAVNRMKFGDLDIASVDPLERDTGPIYDEIFVWEVYENKNLLIPADATILDIGGNIGFYSIWAARRYKPKRIFVYEPSPVTYACLVENVGRHVDTGQTSATCINLAVSSQPGRELVLSQAPFVSGISTLLDAKTVTWAQNLTTSGEITSHKVSTTTVSEQIASRGLRHIDLLKIDVEGHFMEVLAGITPADMAKIGNIVLEADYLEVVHLTVPEISGVLGARGFKTEARDHMIYAWR